ncbi:MAG: DUF1549 domain-containing protein [Verrucomicrobiaceae bacterium]|nr:DUF1549 domain-containing protein [Verrucomicrobiaceae bacterium]
MKSLLACSIIVTFWLGTIARADPKVYAAADAIDALLARDWAANNLTPNAPADDSVFVRRIYLDVVGRIPTSREAEEFLASREEGRRAALIDKLLASEGYVQNYFHYWADVLRVQSKDQQTGPAYVHFVKDALRSNKPYDVFVREMIAGEGKAWSHGAIGYYRRDRGMPLDNMASTVRIFLGTRIECAQCHNHPFDKWTQKQFYEMAAFTFGAEIRDFGGGVAGGISDLVREQGMAIRTTFKQPEWPKNPTNEADRLAYWAEVEKVGRARREAEEALHQAERFYNQSLYRGNPHYLKVTFDERRKVTLPPDYQYDDAKPKSVVEAAAIMGKACTPLPGETRVQAYARWLANPDNDRFNKVVVNRLWKKAFGLALIEPLDDLTDTTVAMNPELLSHLEKLMVSLNYDMKAYLRILFNTSTYQRQASHEEVAHGTAYHFTGPVLRRMTAEQLWDSFVTLINPNPDMLNMTTHEYLEQRRLAVEKVADPAEAFKSIQVAAKKYQAQPEGVEAMQKLLAEARDEAKKCQSIAANVTGPEKKAASTRAAECHAKIKSISREITALYSNARRTVMAEVIIPGQKKLFEKVTGKPWETIAYGPNRQVPAQAAPSADMQMAVAANDGRTMAAAGEGKIKPTKAEVAEAEIKAWSEEAKYYAIPRKQWGDYFRSRAQQSQKWLRAAEIESPAPRGHYLREFGQSDREIIENSNSDASVPQALALMNGELLPQIVHRYSQLMLTVGKAQSADEKIDAAYMAVLSRKPTAREKALCLQAQDKGLSTVEDLIYALINTQQFIFNQ